MKSQLLNWLHEQKEDIETVICEAAKTYFEKNQGRNNFLYDLKCCEQESFNLVQGRDLCYDRPSIGLSYSLWYLARRINTSVNLLIDLFIESIEDNKPIEVLDLGAGTGAIQLTLALLKIGAEELGYKTPFIKVVNIDISPFMLQYNRDFLWPCLVNQYERLNNFDIEYSVNSWTSEDEFETCTPIIIASYLFDHSENRKDILKTFRQLVQNYGPEKVILLTSSQPQKIGFLKAVSEELRTLSYSTIFADRELLFKGSLPYIKDLRNRINQETNRQIFSTNTPSWNEYSFSFNILSKNQGSLVLKAAPQNIEQCDLFLPPVKVRRKIKLNTQQKEASKLTNRPTIITGPAGCGKSVVITERIKNLVEAGNYDSSLKILVTTFNKFLIKYLKDWITELLDSNKIIVNGDKILNRNGSKIIELMNFDILPTQIGGFKRKLKLDPDLRHYLKTYIIPQVCDEFEIERKDYNRYFDERFLIDEYQRVIYGQEVSSVDEYLKVQRINRPYRLRVDSHERKIIAETIFSLLKYLQEKKFESIYTRRHKLLQALKRNEHRDTYTHIFVDEFQDCTQADYNIFYGLIKNNNNIVIGGDFAQAVHLGASAGSPRVDESFIDRERQKNFLTKKLEGSYRVPFRISECIQPLSKHIRIDSIDAQIITPYKGSPPGARPIVVYASTSKEMSNKITWVIHYYKPFNAVSMTRPFENQITILEKDNELKRNLNNWKNGIAETDTILKLKGMEKTCIVWSTKAEIYDKDEFYNYAYTIMTRTSSLLIIALYQVVDEVVYEVLKKLDSQKLILWDAATKEYFDEVINS